MPTNSKRWYLRPRNIGIGVVLIVLLAVVIQIFTRAAPAPVTPPVEAHVKTATIGSLAAQAGPLPVTGTVTSLDQATVLAQASGQIISLPHALGDSVAAGAVIATFENANEQAAALSAEGSYEAAEAALARVSGSTSQNTTNASLAALQSAYSALDDAMHARADQLFTDPKGAAKLILTVPDGTLVSTLERARPALESVLQDAQSIAQSTSQTDVSDNIVRMRSDAQQVVDFLADLITAVNKTPPSQSVSAATLAAYQTSLAAARSEAVGALSGITVAQSAYDANDVNAAEATLKQAQGALDLAKANLAKTIVRSPVPGVIVSLPITRGDYVTINSPVATISNPGALYVETHVTPDDAKTIATGNKATIEGDIAAITTFIAPALDPSTGKIEVKIGIVGGTRSLTDGETVSVALNRNTSVAQTAHTEITIPIVAVKITPTGPVVFGTTASSTLVAMPVTLGSILGDRVVVTGVTIDTSIVTDARGLADGQTVVIDPQ